MTYIYGSIWKADNGVRQVETEEWTVVYVKIHNDF